MYDAVTKHCFQIFRKRAWRRQIDLGSHSFVLFLVFSFAMSMFGRSCDLFQQSVLSLCLTTQMLADLQTRDGRSFGDLKPENILVVGKKLVLIDWCSSRDNMQGDQRCSDLSAAAKQFLHHCTEAFAVRQ